MPIAKSNKDKNEKFSLSNLVFSVFVPSGLFSIGEYALIPIIPASAEKLGADIPTAGVIAGLVMVGILIADLPAAKLVARIGERSAMLYSLFAAMIGILVAYLAANIWMLSFGVFMMGAATAVFVLARHSYMAEHVPISHRARTLSLLGGMFRAGAFIGPLIGALIIAISNVQNVFLLSIAVWAVAALVLLRLKPEKQKPHTDELKSSIWKVVKQEKHKLATIGVAAMILACLRTTRQIGLPLWALTISLDPAATALYIGIAGALDFALFYTSGQVMDKFGRRAAAVPTLIGLAITTFLIVIVRDDSSFLTVALLMSLANGLGSGVILVLGADMSPAKNRNEFLAAYHLLIDAGQAATPLVLSGVAAALGLGFGMSIFGGLGLAAAWVMWRYIPRYANHKSL